MGPIGAVEGGGHWRKGITRLRGLAIDSCIPKGLETAFGLEIRAKLARPRILAAQLQKTAATEGFRVVPEALDGLVPDGLGILLDGQDEGRQELGPVKGALRGAQSDGAIGADHPIIKGSYEGAHMVLLDPG